MRRARSLYASTPRAFADERRDCGVRALRVAAGISYKQAHRMLELQGRRPKGMSYDKWMSRIVSLEVRDLAERAPTLAQFLAAHPAGRFVVRAARHYFAIVDGTVHNWGSIGAGPRCRLVMVWRAA